MTVLLIAINRFEAGLQLAQFGQESTVTDPSAWQDEALETALLELELELGLDEIVNQYAATGSQGSAVYQGGSAFPALEQELLEIQVDFYMQDGRLDNGDSSGLEEQNGT
jgi:NADH:ubiquinone oxidoreductase subunit F (NADH-binding)